MKPQKAVLQETMHIALGTGILCAIMLIVYAVIGRMALPVFLGTLIGLILAVGNFFLMGYTFQRLAENLEPDDKEAMSRAKLKMRSSYLTRMLGLGVALFLVTRVNWIDWVPMVIALLFPRITITVMEIIKKKAPKGSEF